MRHDRRRCREKPWCANSSSLIIAVHGRLVAMEKCVAIVVATCNAASAMLVTGPVSISRAANGAESPKQAIT
jgi:hypothetical protein